MMQITQESCTIMGKDLELDSESEAEDFAPAEPVSRRKIKASHHRSLINHKQKHLIS